MPTILPVLLSDSIFCRIRNSALDCLFPCSLCNRCIVRVDQLQPAQTLQLTRRQSGIVQHMLIETLDGAVRTRHPNHLRDGLSEELESTGKVCTCLHRLVAKQEGVKKGPVLRG